MEENMLKESKGLAKRLNIHKKAKLIMEVLGRHVNYRGIPSLTVILDDCLNLKTVPTGFLVPIKKAGILERLHYNGISERINYYEFDDNKLLISMDQSGLRIYWNNGGFLNHKVYSVDPFIGAFNYSYNRIKEFNSGSWLDYFESLYNKAKSLRGEK